MKVNKVHNGKKWHNHATVSACKSHSQLSSCGFPMVPRTAAAFSLCMAFEMHCRRYLRLRGSPVVLQRRQPSSPTNSSASSPSTPDVSTEKGTKKWLEARCSYLAIFTHSACAATVPGPIWIESLFGCSVNKIRKGLGLLLLREMIYVPG